MNLKEYKNPDHEIQAGFEIIWDQNSEENFGIEFTDFENPPNIKKFKEDVEELIKYSEYKDNF